MEKGKLIRYKNIFGWVGAILVAINYLLLVLNYFHSEDILFNIFQFIGGGLLAARVLIDKDYPVFFLELLFCLVAIFALFYVH
ncbi:MAG: hypothetical protein RI945_15 [Candidatus Parcubacteria bacterium]|jgi:ABC-type microcin C transport system permease subunit YejB